MDYISSEREEQHALLRAALIEHARNYPEALLVIEEYDKLDCATRGFFRQLLENARAANVTLDRCVKPCPDIHGCMKTGMSCISGIRLQVYHWHSVLIEPVDPCAASCS